MSDKLDIAVNHAVNSYRDSLRRQSTMFGGAFAGMDQKRPAAWCEYGFPQNVTFSDLYSLYRRGGIAHGAVNKLRDKCWETLPWAVEGDEQDDDKKVTRWEESTSKVLRSVDVWRAFRDADLRRLVGRYAGLILHYDDQGRAGIKWSSPVAGKRRLLRISVAWANSLTPKDTDTFGNVTAWNYQGSNNTYEEIHPDRIYILGDYGADAIAFLEPAYNNFVSLEKVEGGSGESFLKNAARQLSVSFDKEVDLANIASMYGVSLEKLHEKFNEAARDINRGNDVMLINQGADVSPLVANVPDPRPTYDINLQTASAALDIPSRILVGNQQGERASTEDREYFNARCQSRRNDLSSEISDFLRKLMSARAIEPKDEFAVMWDSLTESTQGAKLENARIMSDINTAALMAGEEIFDKDEIRVAAGYDPSEDLDPLPDNLDDEGGESGEA